MAKNEEKKNTTRMADVQTLSSTDRWLDFLKNTNTGYTGAIGRDSALREETLNSFRNNNNFLPAGLKPGQGGYFTLPESMTGGGGVSFDSSGDFARARGGYQNLADTGGIKRSDFDPARQSYENFIATGGLSGADESNLRYRATSQIPSFYQNVKNDMARRRAIQGGYSPGYDAQMAAATRDSARGSYEASRDAEAAITGLRLEGKKFGTAGSADLASRINQMEQSGRIAGLGGLTNIGNAALQADIENARMADSRAGRMTNAQLSLLDMYQKGGLASSEGLARTYATAPAETKMYLDALLAGLGGLDDSQIGRLGIRAGINSGSNDWWKHALGAGAGVAGAYLGSRGSRA